MRLPRHGTGTLMLLVAVAALAAAMIAQHFRAARNEFWLRADLNRFTPSEHAGGVGKMTLVDDKLVIGFHPAIYRRKAGTRYRWRFDLVGPSGIPILSHRDDREIAVPAGAELQSFYLEVLDPLPVAGNYRGQFFLSLSEPPAPAWSEREVYSDAITLPPRGKGQDQGNPTRH